MASRKYFVESIILTEMKKVLLVLPIMAVTMSICSCGNGANSKQVESSQDSSEVATKTSEEVMKVVAFLNKLYEELENNEDCFRNHHESRLSQFMVKSAMEKLLVESDYEVEGDPYFYDTEFFTDGMVSGSQHGDYHAPFSRDISKDEGYWYNIYTEFEDNIPAPTLIKVKVEKFGEKYMITDVKLN